MLAISNSELKDPITDTIKCDKCGLDHNIEYGEEVLKDGTKIPSKMLAFYKCGKKTYLAGIKGRRI